MSDSRTVEPADRSDGALSNSRFMLVTDHPVFQQPEDPTERIWRYLDVPKLASLLMRRAIFLARGDLLGDPWEGAVGRATHEARKQRAAWFREHYEWDLAALHPNALLRLREATAVSCWHMNTCESAAMWSTYGPQCVAIQSRYDLLRDQFELRAASDSRPFQQPVPPEMLFLGLVKYIDYDRTPIPEGNSMWPIVHKRESYAHEREVRLVASRFDVYHRLAVESHPYPKDGGVWSVYDAGKIDVFDGGGLSVPVDLDTLIERIYIAPQQPEWFAQLVRELCVQLGCHGLAERVHHSQLGADPLF
jgi:hypothetical protein